MVFDDFHVLFRYLSGHRLLMSFGTDFGSKILGTLISSKIDLSFPSRRIEGVLEPTFSEHQFFVDRLLAHF